MATGQPLPDTSGSSPLHSLGLTRGVDRRQRRGALPVLGAFSGSVLVGAALMFVLGTSVGGPVGGTVANIQAQVSNSANVFNALFLQGLTQNSAVSQASGVVHLSWNASPTNDPDRPTQYLVLRRPHNSGSYSQVAGPMSVLTYDDTPAADGSYDYVIEANISTFTSPDSNSVTGLSDRTAPTTTASLSPAANGAGWNKTSPVTVTLSASDGGSGVATTYYKLDDSSCTPSATSNCSTGTSVSVSGNGTHTVYFFSTDSAGNLESQETQTVKIDTVAPTLTVTCNGAACASSWYTSSVSVVPTSSDATSGLATLTYSLNGGAATSISSGSTISLGDSPSSSGHSLSLTATDNAGNTTTQSLTIKVDTTAPGPTTKTLTGGTTGSNGWYTASPTITLASSDSVSGVASTYYQFVTHGAAAPNNTLPGAWSTYSAGFTMTDGDKDLYAFTSDNAGNKETPVNLGELKVDGVAPSTSASLSGTVGTNSWYTTNVTVSLSPTDASSGVSTTYYAVDNSSCAPGATASCSQGTSTTVSSDGNHTVYFFSQDAAGNVESQKTTTFKIDKTAPTLSVTCNATTCSSSWYTSSVSVVPTSSDATSGLSSLTYSLNGGATTSISSGSTITVGDSPNSSGSSLVITAKDNAGNTTTQSLTIKVDSGKPSTTASLSGTVGSNSWYTTAVTVTLTGSDSVSGVATTYYQVDGGGTCTPSSTASCSTYSAAFSVSTDSSSHTVYFFSKDVAGNIENQQTTTFKIDQTAPGPTSKTLTGGTTGTNSWYTASPTITLSSSDATSGTATTYYQFVTHGSAAPSNTLPGSWSTYSAGFTMSDGDNDLYAFTSDNAGNKETPVSLGELKVDSVVPTVSATAVCSFASVAASTGAPAGTIQATTKNWVTKGGSTGSYKIYANATDATSGISSLTGDFGTAGSNPSSSGIAMPSSSSTCAGTTYTYVSASQTAPSTLSAGTNNQYISVHATDNAGNTTQTDSGHTGNVNTDTSTPTAPSSVTGASGGAAGSGLVSVTWPAGSDSNSGVAGYIVQALDQTTSANSQTSAALSSGTTSWTCSCHSGDTYKFKVTIANNAGEVSSKTSGNVVAP